MPIDEVHLNFSPGSLILLNMVLAIVMFAIALDLRVDHFRQLMQRPKPLLVGAVAQFFVLPAATFVLVLMTQPRPSIALGLMLVAACPGGNISNFLSHRAGGNTALSVSLTALATVAAIVLTPLNIAFWAGLYGPTREILRATSIDPYDVGRTVLVMLALPLMLGMLLNERAPNWAAKFRHPMQTLSMLIFMGFVVAALSANWQHFLDLAGQVAGLVIAHNALAFALGFGFAMLAGVSARDRRSITIETGIQNSGLGLILTFAFFQGLGGMAVVAALWGIWHAISGFALVTFWRRRPIVEVD